ncbi:tetratricopeptide repeat protein [Mycolicibacterium wolinskyi]|uniref:Tetratricopeptide repeat protein n=1 Tax=Mycolicibacterium wolinskyi TaxID=59750 RepID=A0A132PGC0_9MYCO|nr:tetratricopeptide repeat protein [Mycolicibacterium wolinskyi]KWX21370.1 tetratricopeptide repeat protein [Mycolicibacterium wolinskyi]
MTSTTDGAGFVAQAYLDSGNYARAEEVLRSALAADPNNADLLAGLARAKIGQKDYYAAALAAHSALAAAPDSEYTKRLYALALQGQGRLPEALWMAWKTVTEHPDVYLAHYVYASMLYSAGHAQQALVAVNEALRLNPASADSWVLRGDIYRSFWGFAAAEADYHEAIRLEPDHASAVNNLAVSRLRRGKTGMALHGFLGAGRLDPGLGELARRNVGVALTGVLRWTTASVVFMAVALIVVAAMHEEGRATVVPRLFAAALTAGFVAVIVWVFRRVPWPALRAVLRERFLLALRLLFVGFAVLAGLAVTVVGSTPLTDVLGPLLLMGVVGFTVLGWLTGQ